jgi:hypothetical protein
MKDQQTRENRCPYLKEIVMVFCEACPIKKMVPLERIQTASHCFGGDFPNCALFEEIAARTNPAPSKKPPRSREAKAAEETAR